ncbi:toprim domain-containing protein [Brevibacillus brevis]|uniref:Toprim domain-containing protein n=1 Tax=Brevibacillus brevis TaxID=1393 RepID=A0ABY9T6T4_BREBE|nr:toprim domain-containing protein [Brevibacillus brevis]WNC15761.1 toprim domain-containing protein [Brevibacillus brevis]
MAGCVIIVEGKTDKERLLRVLAEPVTILCTYGTYSPEKGEELAEQTMDADEVYLFTDEDASGKKLRACLREDFPRASHLHTLSMYAEVANTPLDVLAELLDRAGFAVDPSVLGHGGG